MTIDPERVHSPTLRRLLETVLEADRLYGEGKYDEAKRALRYTEPGEEGSTRTWPLDKWERTFAQEIRERERPEIDYRAAILARVTEEGQPGKYNSIGHGVEPGLFRFGDGGSGGAYYGDERWRLQDAEAAINALVEEGALVYKHKKLWLPETWKRWSEWNKRVNPPRKKAAAPKISVV